MDLHWCHLGLKTGMSGKFKLDEGEIDDYGRPPFAMYMFGKWHDDSRAYLQIAIGRGNIFRIGRMQ